jgi:hypothetical protein
MFRKLSKWEQHLCKGYGGRKVEFIDENLDKQFFNWVMQNHYWLNSKYAKKFIKEKMGDVK